VDTVVTDASGVLRRTSGMSLSPVHPIARG
jgi:hypothetical protein